MKAVDKFEWRRGYKFSTYGVVISGDNTCHRRSSAHHSHQYMIETNKVFRTSRSWCRAGREPTSEIARKMDIPVARCAGLKIAFIITETLVVEKIHIWATSSKTSPKPAALWCFNLRET